MTSTPPTFSPPTTAAAPVSAGDYTATDIDAIAKLTAELNPLVSPEEEKKRSVEQPADEAPTLEVAEEDPATEGEGEADESEEAPPTVRTVKFRAGGEEQELGEDVEFDIKVDGQTKTVTLRDLLDKTSGNFYVEKKIAAAGREMQRAMKAQEAIAAERTRFLGNLEGLMTVIQHGGVEDFADYLGHLTGQDPQRVLEQFMASVTNTVKEIQQLTPEQRAAQRRLKQATLQQQLQERTLTRQQELVRQQKEEQEVRQEMEMFRLTPDDIDYYLPEMANAMDRGELKFVDENGKSRKPDRFDLIDFALERKACERVEKTLRIDDNGLKRELVTKIGKAVAKAENEMGRLLQDSELQKVINTTVERRTQAAKESVKSRADRAIQAKARPSLTPQPSVENKKKATEVALMHLRGLPGFPD